MLSKNASLFMAGAEGFVSPVGSVGASALRAEVSAGDPLLACRLGRCFCTSCRGLHRRPAPLDTLRVPRSLIVLLNAKTKTATFR